jgi:hypothetical protein
MAFWNFTSSDRRGDAPVDQEKITDNDPAGADSSLPDGRDTTGASSEWTPGVFHVDEGVREEFSVWLSRKKEESGLTWEELSDACRVNRLTAYAYNNSDGHPNDPPDEKLSKIARYFETDIEEFHLDSSRRSGTYVPDHGSDEYLEALQVLGDRISDLNERHQIDGTRPQKLSTTVIRHTLGDNFYSRYANTRTKRAALLQELHAHGYTDIELSNQKQNRQSTRKLSSFEQRTIQQVVDEVRESSGEDSLNIAECVRRAHERLLEALPDGRTPRTPHSVRYHIEKYLGIEKQILLDRGSPISQGEDILRQLLEEGIDRVEQEPGAKIFDDTDLPLTDPDPGKQRRNTYLRFASFGHQALIAYLLNPDHYREIFGEKTTLVKVDFSESDTPADLYEKFANDAANTTAPPQQDIIEFVDGWLRCDMIFYSEHTGFIVVEVKQRARNTEQFANATKARQQVASYTSVLRDNIQFRNIHSQSDAIDVRVSGALCAFQIEDPLSQYLIASGSRAVEVPREVVMEYVAAEFSERKNKPAGTPTPNSSDPGEPSSSEVIPPNAEPVSRQAFSTRLWQDGGHLNQETLFSIKSPVLARVDSFLKDRELAYGKYVEHTQDSSGGADE